MNPKRERELNDRELCCLQSQKEKKEREERYQKFPEKLAQQAQELFWIFYNGTSYREARINAYDKIQSWKDQGVCTDEELSDLLYLVCEDTTDFFAQHIGLHFGVEINTKYFPEGKTLPKCYPLSI